MKLSTKLILVLSLIVLVATVVVGGVTFQSVRAALQQSISQNQIEIARETMDKIDRLLHERYLDIQSIAEEESLELLLNDLLEVEEVAQGQAISQEEVGQLGDREDAIKLTQRRLQELTFLTGPWDILFVADRDGVIIVSTDESEIGRLVETEPANSIAHERALNGEVYFSDLIISDDTGQPTIVFAAPIRAEESAGRPVVAVAIAHFSWPIVLEVLQGVGQDVHLYNNQGELIGAPEEDREETLLVAGDDSELVVRWVLGGQLGTEIIVGGHEQVQLLLSAVSQQGYLDYRGNGWVLELGTPTQVALASANSTALQSTILVVGLNVLTAVVVLLLIDLLVVRPVVRLTRAAQAIAGGDLDRRVAVASTDEIGELAEAFNEMTDGLRQARDELEERSKELTGSLRQVEQQNIDLENTKKATLNILEDVAQGNTQLKKEVGQRQKTEKELLTSNKRLQEIAQKLMAAQTELEKAIAEKGEFMNIAAHELRTPLQPIIGYVSRLLARDDTTSWQREKLNIILKSSDRLLRLVQDILDMNKLETGVMKFNWEQIDMMVLLKDIYESFEPMMEEKKLQFTLDVPDTLTPLIADAHRLTQVFSNLLNNAVKFTPKGSITITAREGANAISVAVTDTGIGIPEGSLSGLFTKFYQVESYLKRSHEGTGLGLAISREIARAHGGEIVVTSTEGIGSTFRVVLSKARG